jgi:hypothetical protein
MTKNWIFYSGTPGWGVNFEGWTSTKQTEVSELPSGNTETKEDAQGLWPKKILMAKISWSFCLLTCNVLKINIWISLQELQVSSDCDGVLLESVDVTEYHTRDAHSKVDIIIEKYKINKQPNVENIKVILYNCNPKT